MRWLEQILLHQRLGNLHGIGGSALAQIVADYPKIEAAWMAGVSADATNQDLILPCCVNRHRVAAGIRIVHDGDAGSLSEKFATPIRGKLPSGLHVD